MHSRGKKIKIFSGNSNKGLAKKICGELGVPLGDVEVKTFSDGEIAINLEETVRGVDVYVIQSTSPPAVNTYLM